MNLRRLMNRAVVIAPDVTVMVPAGAVPLTVTAHPQMTGGIIATFDVPDITVPDRPVRLLLVLPGAEIPDDAERHVGCVVDDHAAGRFEVHVFAAAPTPSHSP